MTTRREGWFLALRGFLLAIISAVAIASFVFLLLFSKIWLSISLTTAVFALIWLESRVPRPSITDYQRED